MSLNATILQIIPALAAGGAERTTVEITQAIVAAGGKALAASSGGRLVSALEAAGGTHFALNARSKNPAVIYANAGRIAEIVREHAVDLLHVRSRAPAWSALWAARRTGAKLVATYHGAYGAGSALKRFYNSAMLRGDAVIANSAFTAEAIRRQYRSAADGALAEKLTIIPRGADLAAFDPRQVTSARRDALLEGWRLAPMRGSALKLLAPARATPWKGQADIIEALAIAAGQNASQSLDFQVVFCGDDKAREDYVASLKAAAARLGVCAMTAFVGHCADMPAAYAWADVVLAPSRRPEAFGRVAVEAGAMGKPIVAADHGGACETVVDGVTGIRVPPGHVEALARAILRLAAMSASEREQMGARGRKRVEENFTVDAMGERTIAVYKKVLGA